MCGCVVVGLSCRDHSGSSSRYSTPPLNSRTPSGGYPATPATPCEERAALPSSLQGGQVLLDDVDGLAPPHSDVQIRLQQIVAENQVSQDYLFKRHLITTSLYFGTIKQ